MVVRDYVNNYNKDDVEPNMQVICLLVVGNPL
jgi:hypothetical protein